MAILSLEDQYGQFEAVLFPGKPNRRGETVPGPYEKFAHDCEPDLVALFCGKLDRRERRPSRPVMTSDDGEAPIEEANAEEELVFKPRTNLSNTEREEPCIYH